MKNTITLKPHERQSLLCLYRHHPDAQVRLRAHILLLLADNHSWALICTVLFCSPNTIARWQQRFHQGGIDALASRRRGRALPLLARWTTLLVTWVTQTTPRAFGFVRSRWCCAVLVLLLWRNCRVQVSRETVRRCLHQCAIVWRRPRPVLERTDPQREPILEELRALLRELPDDETVVFQDEVDLNLNPDIGFMWMKRGQQAEVVTPGDNVKRYLAGSLHWRSGVLLTTAGSKRDSALFVRHLDDLRRRLRRYRVIHVICDNARFHRPERCRAVQNYLKEWGHRIRVHFLPRYAPETNPIERVWWHLREEITRNHTCQTIEELIELVMQWLTDRKSFPVEDSVYRDAKPQRKKKATAA
jgi:transposase